MGTNDFWTGARITALGALTLAVIGATVTMFPGREIHGSAERSRRQGMSDSDSNPILISYSVDAVGEWATLVAVPIGMVSATIRIDPRDEDQIGAYAQHSSDRSTTRRVPFAERALYRYEEDESNRPFMATVPEPGGRPWVSLDDIIAQGRSLNAGVISARSSITNSSP